jgi:hypothetical protein
MGVDQSQNESGHVEALPTGQVRHCTRREPRRSAASGVAGLRHFGVERVEQRVSEAKVAADIRGLGPIRRSTGRRKKARRR